MRAFISVIFFIIFIVNSTAQRIKIIEDFESNTLGWTEILENKGQAIISEGVMQIESKGEQYHSTAWTDLDPNVPFEITVDVKVRRLDGSRTFGIILDFLFIFSGCLIVIIKFPYHYLIAIVYMDPQLYHCNLLIVLLAGLLIFLYA